MESSLYICVIFRGLCPIININVSFYIIQRRIINSTKDFPHNPKGIRRRKKYIGTNTPILGIQRLSGEETRFGMAPSQTRTCVRRKRTSSPR